MLFPYFQLLLLRESLFECPFSQANVAFANDISAFSSLCFVYDVVREAMVVQWAFVFVSDSCMSVPWAWWGLR